MNQLHSTCTVRISNWFNSGTVCAGLERENLYTQPDINSMVNHLSFFKRTRPNLLQTWQTRYQSTPLYLYIQNIKSVCDSGTVCAELEREHLITPNRILNRWSIALAFSNLRDQIYFKQDKLGINQLHSTCTFRISNWFVTLVQSVLD